MTQVVERHVTLKRLPRARTLLQYASTLGGPAQGLRTTVIERRVELRRQFTRSRKMLLAYAFSRAPLLLALYRMPQAVRVEPPVYPRPITRKQQWLLALRRASPSRLFRMSSASRRARRSSSSVPWASMPLPSRRPKLGGAARHRVRAVRPPGTVLPLPQQRRHHGLAVSAAWFPGPGNAGRLLQRRHLSTWRCVRPAVRAGLLG